MTVQQHEAIKGCAIGEKLMEAVEYLDKLHNGVAGGAFSTGYAALDERIGGLIPRCVLLFAAPPGTGLTSWALGMARRVALAPGGTGVGFLCLGTENSVRPVVRLLVNQTVGGIRKVRGGALDSADWQQLLDAAGEVKNAPLYFGAAVEADMPTLRKTAEAFQQEHRIRVLFVDNIQHIQPSAKEDGGGRKDASILAGLPALAQDLDICVVALAPLTSSAATKAASDTELVRELGTWGTGADVMAVLQVDGDGRWSGDGGAEVRRARLRILENNLGSVGSVMLEPFPDEVFPATVTPAVSADDDAGCAEPDMEDY